MALRLAQRSALLVIILLAALWWPVAPAVRAQDAPPSAPALRRGSVTKRPYVVMIDNHPAAYPQTGLNHTVVVFEALAEYGITRFMAVYAPGITPEAAAIGPVRSARIYFVQWAMGFQGLFAHAGGSPTGLALAESTDRVVNLDALLRSGGAYFVRSRARYAPHNLYTSSAALARAAEVRNTAEINDPEIGFLYKESAPPEARPAEQQISYYFASKASRIGWVYDHASNTYLRLRRSKPARDAASSEQIQASNVIVMEVHGRPVPGDPKQRIEQDVIGSGPARLFQDGIATDITWKKESAEAQLRFYNADGAEVQFNVGRLWIAAVPSLDNLTIN